MKYSLAVLSISILFFGAGCALSPLSPVTTSTSQLLPGQKFGQMTLQKVENNEATFTGTATITGIHFVSELDGNICFVPDASSLLKIPNLRKDPSGNQFCFTNQDGAKALLGVNNGKAAIVITGYRDWTIDTSQTPQTTLVQLAN